MYTITKSFRFCAAHRLLGHPKCGRPHGHEYVVFFELQAEELDNGMVRDYADLSRVKERIDNTLDHRYLVSRELVEAHDPFYAVCLENDPSWAALINVQRTTAEQLAEWFYNEWKADYQELVAVTVCETSATTATYRFNRGLR